jgi:hypothetical protein
MPQLKLQARSMAIFLKQFPISNILVVVNDVDFEHCENYFYKNVIDKYEWLGDRVKLIDGISLFFNFDKNRYIELSKQKIFYRHLTHNMENNNKFDDTLRILNILDGWITQQKIKIKISNLVKTKDYCILDCKNFLTTYWKTEDIINSEGKFKTTFKTLNPKLNNIESFNEFGLDASEHTRVRCSTPYFAPTAIVQKLSLNDKIFEKWSRHKNNFVEFSLIQAAMIADNIMIEDYYFHCEQDHWQFGILPEDISYLEASDKNFTDIIHQTYEKNKILVAGLHRKIFSNLSNDLEVKLLKMSAELDILDSKELSELFREMKDLNPLPPQVLHQFA